MIKILTIDDNRDNLTVITALLKNLMPECAVITAPSGPEGIEKALAELPDTVLLDIHMPGMDGFETCRRLKADERTRPIPVVMITAVSTDAPSRIKSLAAGADAFLSKPIDEQELVSQLKVALRIKAAEDALRAERDSLEASIQERTAELRESEKRFRAASDASLDCMILLRSDRDEAGRIKDFIFVELNRRTEEMLGMSRDQMIGKRLCEELPINREAGFFEKYKRVAETGEPLLEEFFLPETHVPGCWYFHQVVRMNDGIFICHRDISERKQAEKSLRDSRDLLDTTQRLAKVGGWEWDVARQMMSWTDEAYCIHGFEPGEVAAGSPEHIRRSLACYDPDDRPVIEAAFRRCAEEGRSYDLEVPFTTAQGRRAWVKTMGRAVMEDKRVVKVLGNIMDITAHKQAEKALRDSETTVRKKLKAVLEPEGDIGALCLADIIDHKALQSMMEDFYRFLKIGSAIVDLSGKILVAVGWQDICTKFHRVHPDTGKNCLESDLVLSSGVPEGQFKVYRCKNNLWDMATPIVVGGKHMGNIYLGQFFFEDEIPDYELFRKQARHYGFDETEYLAALDRVPRWSQETINSVMAFYAKLAGMISSLSYSTLRLSRDIAERKRSGKALQESEERFKSLHNASFGGIAIHDKGIILECNQGLADMTGYSAAELTGGMDGLMLLAEKSRNDVMNKILSGYEKPYEAIGLRKNGEEYPMRLEGRNIPYKGKMVRTVEFRDITEQKRAEAEREKLQAQLIQAQKMESVGRLAGGVAHDFNNMLSVILGHAEIALEKKNPDDPLHEDLMEIIAAAQRSANLTRQLLTFARKQTIAPKIIDLNETVDGMLKMLRRLIGEDIDLLWNPGRNLGSVKVDPSQIDQLLANLCVNARDAIKDIGKITIETGSVAFDEAYCADHPGFSPGEYVLLAVSDNGCGMDPETIGHLFEPFFTTKELGKGTGLGLASVYGMVKQNHGFINVYSEPGQGTIFNIFLPRHAAKAALVPEKDQDPPVEGGFETILLVEDEPAILKMTAKMLEKLGYTVIRTETPGEAIRLAHEYNGRIDMLMTDVVMPEMNGRDLAGNLLSIYPGIKRLFMSGYTANVIAHHGVLDKGVHFIQKPFSRKDLAAKVREAMGE